MDTKIKIETIEPSETAKEAKLNFTVRTGFTPVVVNLTEGVFTRVVVEVTLDIKIDKNINWNDVKNRALDSVKFVAGEGIETVRINVRDLEDLNEECL